MRQWLTASLLLGLAGALSLGAVACQSNAPSANPSPGSPAAPAPNAAQNNAVAQKLQGEWQPEGGGAQQATLMFTSDGKAYILDGPAASAKQAIPMNYTMNVDAKPMQIDLQMPGENRSILTIFEFTQDGKLRWDGGKSPGDPRPTSFSEKSAVFKKLSDQASLPASVKVLDPTAMSQGNQAGQSEGRTYVGSMNRAQQAFYLENNKFATSIDQLGLGIKPESDSYSLKIENSAADQVVMTATAKKPELKSYTGVVAVDTVNGQATTISYLCESEQGSAPPPSISGKVKSTGFQCPTGSVQVR